MIWPAGQVVVDSIGGQAGRAIVESGKNIRAEEVRLADWSRVFLREAPAGLILGAILCVIGILRVVLWQILGWQDYGEHWFLLALAIGLSLLCIVAYGSLVGSMLPFALRSGVCWRWGWPPA